MASYQIPNKKIVVVIPHHNQKSTVELCISHLLLGTRVPDLILVIDDHSDPGQELYIADKGLVKVEPAKYGKGRSSTRNQGIRSAMEEQADFIIFLDGDTIPESEDFVYQHVLALSGGPPGRMHFSTRRHIPRPTDFRDYLSGTMFYPSEKCTVPPSDYLTANMDNLYKGKPMVDTDLRVVSRTIEEYGKAQGFDEKCDLILSGMVTWSCNFSLDAEAAVKINKLMKDIYHVDGWFDDTVFNTGWGYEDVALGLDALFAGVDIRISDGPRVLHFMHNRSDDLHSHIQGRHRIMERYRKLMTSKINNSIGGATKALSLYMSSGLVAYADRSRVYLNGRMMPLPEGTSDLEYHSVLSVGSRVFVDGWELDITSGQYSRSLTGMLLNWLSKRK